MESCAICSRTDKPLWLVSKLNPRVLRLLQLKFPLADFVSSSSICKDHVSSMLQSRIEDLLQEDQNQFSKLQEDAMRNLEKYEIEERGWKDQFDKDRSFGERCADNVAKFGGSWGFLGFLSLFILGWMFINWILAINQLGWDPYPFILLNLILSMLAASQAPSILILPSYYDVAKSAS